LGEIAMKKLVAISIRYRGQTVNVFTYGEQGDDGKVRVSREIIYEQLEKLGVGRGHTYSMG
jgi:hypothetical protein